MYVLRQLLSLKQRYPTRVHFLMGNRDINKMRIVNELGILCEEDDASTAGDNVDCTLPHHDGVYWLRGTENEESIVPTSAAERLKWMLRRTMGSVDAFQLRREELQRERFAVMNQKPVSLCPLDYTTDTSLDAASAAAVSDEEVVQSYMQSCCPVAGIMSQCK